MDRWRALTKAEQVFTAVSTDGGYITRIDGRALGEIAMEMGAGRAERRRHRAHGRHPPL